jgi:putative endonuclease
MKYFVYVIKSIEGYKYTGVTSNLEKRLNEHNNKSLSFWTKRGTNWNIIYKEDFDNSTDAWKREKWLKSGNGRKFINDLISK